MNQEIQDVLDGKSEGCIVCGDCLAIMKDMPDKCVDAVVTDPPYGVEFKRQEWDKNIPNWYPLGERVSKIQIVITAPETQWYYPKPNWVCCWYRPASSSRSLLNGGFNHWSPVLVWGENIKFKVDSINLHAIANSYPKGFPHPSPKPIALMVWLVNEGIQANEIILDPFCGSGTTCVAAKKLGRRYIGIDISEEYCRISRNRLRDTERPLFDIGKAVRA